MYIQDSELASTFHEKETEYIENSEREILETIVNFWAGVTRKKLKKE